MTRTDADLLALARTDPLAFREFYDRYASWVHSWFSRQTGADSAALDLTAETFAQAWHASRRFKDMADGSGAVEARVGLRGDWRWRPGMTGEASVTLRESNLWGALWWSVRRRVRTDLLL